MNEMNTRILALWNDLEEDFPDKSTEWIMSMVCDQYDMLYNSEIDHGDVAEALYQDSIKVENDGQ